MNYFIIFISIFCLFIFAISNGTEQQIGESTAEEDKNMPTATDDEYIAFVKGLPSIDGPKFEADVSQEGKMLMLSLGIMYSMKQDLNCEKIVTEIAENEGEKLKCKIFNRYMKYIYEYLFRVYVEAHYRTTAAHLPAVVKPKFEMDGQQLTLRETMLKLGGIYSFFYEPKVSRFYEYKLHPMLQNPALSLSNEDELKSNEIDSAKMPEALLDEMPKIQNHFDKMLEAMAADNAQNE